MVVILGLFFVLRILYNSIKYRTKSDFFLFIILLLIGGFSLFEFTGLILIAFKDHFPSAILDFYISLNNLFHLLSVSFLILGAVILNLLIRWLITSGGFNYYMEKWKVLLVLALFGSIIYINVFEIKTIYLNEYPVTMINAPFISLIITIAPITIMFFSIAPNYFKFINTATKRKYGKKRGAYTFTVIITATILIYAFCVVSRVHFGDNWYVIITLDVIMLTTHIGGLIASFRYGFGDTLLCFLSMESIYVSDSSGRLIYRHRFIERSDKKDEFIGAFLHAINAMIQVIRSEESKIERLVLEDNSEIILSIGKYCRGIIIVKKYNTLFKIKLESLISKIENEENALIQQWSGKKGILNERIERFIDEIF